MSLIRSCDVNALGQRKRANEMGVDISLMTFNIGGGRKDFGSSLDSIIQVIAAHQPDLLGLQEAVELVDADKNFKSTVQLIADGLGYIEAKYFGATLSMRAHFNAKKTIFTDGLFRDWIDWRQGNALLSRWRFTRLGDAARAGEPSNLPLFQPVRYEGSRDTDPRHLIIARVRVGPVAPFVMTTHLSTLVGERGGPAHEMAGKTEQAQTMRIAQVEEILALVGDALLKEGELVFLMGDFNAPLQEPSMQLLQEAGFVPLQPENSGTPTHLFKIDEPIDHIFVYPATRLEKYTCQIVDTPLARKASDHLPVLARVTVS